MFTLQGQTLDEEGKGVIHENHESMMSYILWLKIDEKEKGVIHENQ